MVAKVDEEQAAMVADAMHPAGQADGLADVVGAERAAGMGSVTVHLVHGIGSWPGAAAENARGSLLVKDGERGTAAAGNRGSDEARHPSARPSPG